MITLKKETRKVTQMGNSLGVGLPKSIIDHLKIKRGDEMEFEVIDGKIVLHKKTNLENEIDAEMLKMVQETFNEHDELFKRLK